jgi:hypothetical protein
VHGASSEIETVEQGDRNMKLTLFVAGLCLGIIPVGSGPAFAQTAQTETKLVTVDGEVVRYEPGRVIVIRGADNREVIYGLSPGVVVPAEVKVGRRVMLYTEPRTDGGTQLVTRVTTTSVTPEGQVKRTTEDTRTMPSGETTKTTTTTISGTVAAYESGKTLTITRSDGSKATYLINEKSMVPSDLVIGKTVAVVPVAPAAPGQQVVQTITYVTTETVPKN